MSDHSIRDHYELPIHLDQVEKKNIGPTYLSDEQWPLFPHTHYVCTTHRCQIG